jgi:hypothetical protein
MLVLLYAMLIVGLFLNALVDCWLIPWWYLYRYLNKLSVLTNSHMIRLNHSSHTLSLYVLQYVWYGTSVCTCL